MGAVPGSRLLIVGRARTTTWFDVESFRQAGRRVTIRPVDHVVLVLGSTQPETVVDHDRASRLGVMVARRRSGGGAVLLSPGAQVWIDLWVPSVDRLWMPEPRRQAQQVGEWWAHALGWAGAADLTVHREGSTAVVGSDLVCFAGIGPGEVTAGGRKLVGLAQWRSREGALVHGCAYHRWDPGPLVDLLQMEGERRAELGAALVGRTAGLDETGAGSFSAEGLVGVLPDDEPWEVVAG